MITTSIIMTVFNRPWRVLWNTLHALNQNDLTGCELVIVDDGSTLDYTEARRFCEAAGLTVQWLRIEASEYPSTTYMLPHPDGGVYNNSALAANRGIAAARGKRLMFLSSDCMVPKHAIASAKKCGDFLYLATVMDQETCNYWVDEHRLIPVNWFSAVRAEHVHAVGGFDEKYLGGMGFEDADFGARLGIYLGHLVFDLGTVVVHQSHAALAYVEGQNGYQASQDYTKGKWGGLPWDDDYNPLVYEQYRDKTWLRVNVRLRDGYLDPLAGLRR